MISKIILSRNKVGKALLLKKIYIVIFRKHWFGKQFYKLIVREKNDLRITPISRKRKLFNC